VRTFVAVDIEEETRAAAALAIAELARRLAGSSESPEGIRWVDPHSMHVTLHFVGHVGEAELAGLRAAVEEPFDVAPFDLEIGGLGLFPTSGPSRVVWLGITAGADSLTKLHATLTERLRAAGLPTEHRTYKPHLTLGRVKSPRGSELRKILADAALPAIPGSRIARVTLYESRSARGAPEYVPLASSALG
jgi:2'-5' RNA ligase